jgi:fatty acid desaturase
MIAARRRHFRVSRDTILFTTGLVLLIYAVLVPSDSRTALVPVLVLMMGLPTLIRSDEAKHASRRADSEDGG